MIHYTFSDYIRAQIGAIMVCRPSFRLQFIVFAADVCLVLVSGLRLQHNTKQLSTKLKNEFCS